jgi:hypothetical protein
MKKLLLIATVFIISQVLVSCFRNKVEIIKDLDYSDMKITTSGSISQEKKFAFLPVLTMALHIYLDLLLE